MIDNDIIQELIVYNPVNKKIKFGTPYDGGYVLIDGYDYDYYISCGIEWNVSFDIDFCNYKKNIKGLAFDGTVNRPFNLPNNIDFYKKNIGPKNSNFITNLNEESKNYKNIFLKMDIESHEWNWLLNYNFLNNCKQIILEVHGLFDEDWMKIGNYEYENILKCLKKLNETHYLVHFHGNNAGGKKIINKNLFPTVGEMTLIRKNDCHINGLNKMVLPDPNLDCPNSGTDKDINLNFWPFISE